MKTLFRASAFITLYLLVSACGVTTLSTPSTVTPLPSPAMITVTHLPSRTATATLEPTPSPAYIEPTFVPTIDPTRVPDVLKNAFSIQTLEGVNGHSLQRITGWNYGFGGGSRANHCDGYYWLDASHLLLYPAAGEAYVDGYGGVSTKVNMAPQPVVISFKNKSVWLPPIDTSSSRECRRVYWSQELGILVTSEMQGDISTVSTYTKDGSRLSSHPGKLLDISPRGTKVLISDDTLLDLKTNKTIKLAWSLEDYYEPILSDLYWTYPDETRVYRCCYFYADVTKGISHRFQRSDFQFTDGQHLKASGLWFHQGEWVRDNKYFLVSWLVVDDGPVKYLPMFDPNTKLFYDVWEMAGISPDWEWLENEVSPDGNYVWMAGWQGSYLVNLTTFESQYYPYRDPYTYTDADWSADSKFVWFQFHGSNDQPTEFRIVSLSDKKSRLLPVTPLANSDHWWHPTKAAVVYPAADKNVLIFLDPSTMSYQELPLALQKLPDAYGNVVYGKVVWSPNGDKLAMIAENGSVWQVDYPDLAHLEQLTPPLQNVHSMEWSPDGNSIAFISGSDIYVVDTER